MHEQDKVARLPALLGEWWSDAVSRECQAEESILALQDELAELGVAGAAVSEAPEVNSGAAAAQQRLKDLMPVSCLHRAVVLALP